MTKFRQWLHPPSAMQALTVVETRQNSENRYHINVALVVPRLAAAKDRRGAQPWQGDFTVTHWLPAPDTKAWLPAVLFVRDRK